MFRIALVLCVVAAASASWGGHGLGGTIVGPSSEGLVLQGPSAKASLVGPDGSHISAHIPGAAVIADPRHGGAISASVVPGHVSHGHGHGGVVVGHGLGLGLGLGHGLGLGLGVHGGHGSVISGPAGVVVSDGLGGHGGVWGAGVHGGAWGAGVHGGWGHGHEGQWIPDHNEAHYDDGSYHGEGGHYGGHW